MARLRDYYGPPAFEQEIIDAIRAGKAPGRYTEKDIIEDDGLLPKRKRKKLKGSLMMGGLQPPGYNMMSYG